MIHKHHIIPRHMGGSDDPSNLIELTVEQHADAHRILYETYGKIEDKIAWLGLSGIIAKQEIVCLSQKLGGKLGREKTNDILKERYGEDWQRIISKKGTDRMREILDIDPSYLSRVNTRAFLGKHHSDITKNKMRETYKNNNHQQGTKNSQYGTMWITNGVENKKIKKDTIIPEGWIKGRKIKQ